MTRKMPKELPDHLFGPEHCMQCYYSKNVCARCMDRCMEKLLGRLVEDEKSDVAKTPHEWRTSRLGHGESQCIHCFATNREIEVVGDMNHCPDAAAKAKGGDA